jgi:hypothetical protein
MGTVNPYRQLKSAPVQKTASAPQSVEQAIPAATRTTVRVASKEQEKLVDDTGAFNPPAFGGYTDAGDIQAALGSPKNRMFSASGEINASDKRDALQQIAYLLNNVTKKTAGSLYREASPMKAEERRKILAGAMRDPSGEGFAIVGQELLLPIKDIIDYEGWVRKIFRVRPLAQGELFRVAKDVRATAWVIGQDGQGIESRLSGKYVMPSEFKIASFPSVDIEDIYQMNFDVLDRAQDTARQEIELEEDKRGLSLIDRASTTVNATTIFTTLGVAALEDIRYQVERHRLVVDKFLINRREVTDLVKTAVGLNGSQTVDPVTQRETILAGYVGNVLNAAIITAAGTGVQEVVPAGTVYACTSSEYMGEMGIRVELFSEPFNKYSHREMVKGWAFGEICGFVLPNSRSVAKGHK